MDYSIERLAGGAQKLGCRHYRRDYGTVVYSEYEVHLWRWLLYVSFIKQDHRSTDNATDDHPGCHSVQSDADTGG